MKLSEFIILPIFVVVMIFVFRWLGVRTNAKKRLEKTGYNWLWQSPVVSESLWIKDGTLYSITKYKPESAVIAEVMGVSTIRKGARLTGLLLRYRANGRVTEARIVGTSSQLLTIADELGYGG